MGAKLLGPGPVLDLLGVVADVVNTEFGLVCNVGVIVLAFSEKLELDSMGGELNERDGAPEGGGFRPGHASLAYFFFENASGS